VGVPGRADIGGALAPSGDVADLTSADWWPPNTAAQSYQRINLAQRGRSGKAAHVNAICIAADSAIHTCEIALVGKDGELFRHMVSPGNPLLGDLSEYDFALVSIPESMPSMALNSAIVHWDTANTTVADGSEIVGFPLRLELWRGDVLPMRVAKRAPYHAHAIYSLAPAEEDAEVARYLRVCVDGRRWIQVRGNIGTGGSGSVSSLTLTAFGKFARKSNNAPTVDGSVDVALALDDAGTLTNTTWPFLLNFEGAPLTVLEIVLVALGGAGGGQTFPQLHVAAWD
jgi:hypothetical protein